MHLALLMMAAVTVTSPEVRVDVLDPARYSALGRDVAELEARFGRPPVRVQALGAPHGGAWLLVGFGEMARLYHVNAGNRVTWKQDGAFAEHRGDTLLVPDPEGSGFAVVLLPRRADENPSIRRFDAAGRVLATFELALPTGHVMLDAWAGVGWLVAGVFVARGRTPRLWVDLVDASGGRPWGSAGRLIAAPASASFAMIRTQAEDRYYRVRQRLGLLGPPPTQPCFLFVWQDSAHWDAVAPEYRAQEITPEGVLRWPAPIRLGDAAKYSMCRWRAPELRRVSGGVEIALKRGMCSDVGDRPAPYVVVLWDSGLVQPVARVFLPVDPPGWAGSLPFFQALPLHALWEQVKDREGGSPLRSCALLRRGFRYVSSAPNGLCPGPEPSLPAKAGDEVRLVTRGRRVGLRDAAAGPARPEPPMVGYATRAGAAIWTHNVDGLHTWILFDRSTGARTHRFEVVGPYTLRERNGAVEVVADDDEVVLTVREADMRPHRRDAHHTLRVRGRAVEVEVSGAEAERVIAVRLTWVEGEGAGGAATGEAR